jgi:ribosomal-protein-alanine N-acetyltransferase
MSRLPLRIRNTQADDLEVLYQIDQICFPEDIAFSRIELAFYLNHPQSIAWVAEEPAGILGFVLAHVENATRAHVLTLDVVPAARQCSIGTSLMDTLHRELRRRKIEATILEVGIQNVPAQRLYEKLRYQYLRILPGYYHGREDAYQMAHVVYRGSKSKTVRARSKARV